MLSFQASTKTFWKQETAHLPARASLLNSFYYWLRNNFMYLLFLWDLLGPKISKNAKCSCIRDNFPFSQALIWLMERSGSISKKSTSSLHRTLAHWWTRGLCDFFILRYKGPENTKNAKKFVVFEQIAYFQGWPRPIWKMRMCLNVIPEVLAILAIGLMNIIFVSLSGFKIQGPENATYADLFPGGGLEGPISQNVQGCWGVIRHFLKRHALLSIINHKKNYTWQKQVHPQNGFWLPDYSHYNIY